MPENIARKLSISAQIDVYWKGGDADEIDWPDELARESEIVLSENNLHENVNVQHSTKFNKKTQRRNESNGYEDSEQG